MSEKDFDKAVFDYYKLKQNYEKSYKTQKDKILKNPLLSKRDRQLKLLKLKSKCIKCKNLSGTVFSNKDGILKAVCGNTNQPCDLHIELKKGDYYSMEDIMNDTLEDAENAKEGIILNKLQLLFNYFSEEEALKEFTEDEKTLNENLDVYSKIRTAYLQIVDNIKNKIKIKNLDNEIFIQVSQIKDLVKKYNDTDSESFIKDVISLYRDELLGKLKEVMDAKYAYVNVEYNDSDDTYHLIQKPYTLEDVVYDNSDTLESDSKIIANKK